MAVTVDAEGSQTATIGVEHTLHTVTAAGVYQTTVDLSNLANGDTVEIRVKARVESGGAYRLLYPVASYDHDQGDAAPPTPAYASAYGYQVTLKQTAGTGRAFRWRVDKVG